MLILSFSLYTPSYKTIDSNQVKTAFIINSSPTFKGYHYQGSDEEYHYFITKWDWTMNDYFRLKKEDLEIDTMYEFKTRELKIDV